MSEKIIERKIIPPQNFSLQNTIIAHIEIGSLFSKGALVTIKDGKKEPRLIKETKMNTRKFIVPGKTGKYKTITNQTLSEKSIKQITNQTISNLFKNTELSLENINYLSTQYGEYASLKTPSEVSSLINKITTYSQEKFRNKLKEIKFNTPKITGNEIKSKMVSNGGKRIIKSKSIDPPQVFLDFSTYLSGIAFSDLEKNQISCFLSGLGFEIFDALARGHGDINSENGTTLQIPKNGGEVYEEVATELTSQVSEILNIQRIPSGTNRFGKIPVNVNESYEDDVKLVGCDIGKNGSNLEKVTKIGRRAASYGSATLRRLIDKIQARLIGKVVKTMYEENLLNTKNSVCISGRWENLRNKTKILTNHLKDIGFKKIAKNLKFIENPDSFGTLPKIQKINKLP